MLAELVLSIAAKSPPETDVERVARALTWLESRVDADDWSRADAGRANVGGKRIVVDAVVGWLELVRTDKPADAALLEQLDKRIRSHLGDHSGTFGAFANWADGFAALYFIERELRERGGGDALAAIVKGFAHRQNAEGGWDHGASFGVSFYPSTLVATTNLALVAFGFARRLGLDVDAQALTEGLQLLRDVQSEDGGMPYGGRPYKKGVEAGRTCGTVLALSSLGLGADPRCTRGAHYVMRNVDAIPDGHASTAFHVFVGALACATIGKGASATYDERVLARVRSGQTDDGAFQSLVADGPDDMAIMADAETNRAYVTALHAAALLARSSKTARALQLDESPALAVAPSAAGAAFETVWNGPQEPVALVAHVGERIVAVDESGNGRWLVAADGKPTGTFAVKVDPLPGQMACTSDEHGLLVWRWPSGNVLAIVMGGGMPGGGEADPHTSTISLVSPEKSGPSWSRSIDGRIHSAVLAGEHVVVRTMSGRIHVLARADGAHLRELPSTGVLPNAAMFAGVDDTLVMTAEALLSCVPLRAPATGTKAAEPVWQRKNRLRALTPPSWTAICASDKVVVAGRTDGTLAALDVRAGSTLWEAQTSSAIRSVALDASSGRAFALTYGGRLIAFDAGHAAWTTDIDGGFESHGESQVTFSGEEVWCTSSARRALVCVDAKDGRVRASLAWERGRSFVARGRTLFVADENGVRALRAHRENAVAYGVR